MRLKFPDTLRDRLRDIHRIQRAEMSPDWFSCVESVFPEGAVFLWVGMGYANYITLGGQVAFTSPDGSPPRIVRGLTSSCEHSCAWCP